MYDILLIPGVILSVVIAGFLVNRGAKVLTGDLKPSCGGCLMAAGLVAVLGLLLGFGMQYTDRQKNKEIAGAVAMANRLQTQDPGEWLQALDSLESYRKEHTFSSEEVIKIFTLTAINDSSRRVRVHAARKVIEFVESDWRFEPWARKLASKIVPEAEDYEDGISAKYVVVAAAVMLESESAGERRDAISRIDSLSTDLKFSRPWQIDLDETQTREFAWNRLQLLTFQDPDVRISMAASRAATKLGNSIRRDTL